MVDPQVPQTVHKILQDSVFEESAPGTPTSFRVDAEIKAHVQEICFRHGSDISSFLRQCCRALASEYPRSN